MRNFFNDVKFPQKARSKCFTKLDESSGDLQMKIDKQSSDLLVFNNSFGRYKFLRLPLEYTVLVKFSSTASLKDDIIIHASTREVHDERVRLVLNRVL